MTQTVIQEAAIADLRSLNRLFVQAVRSHFAYFPDDVQDQVIRDHRLLQLAKAILHPQRLVLVARQNGKLVGYAIGSAPKGGSGQLYWLYVDPSCRGQNIGLSLLSRALKQLAQQGANEVVLATHDHRRYYERQGFGFVERRTIDGVPMDIMLFRLGGSE